MELIKAYVYNTELDCQNAIDLINLLMGIPVSIDAITRTYTNFEFNNGKYIIKHDKTIESVLGLPIDFEYIPQVNAF
jgi:uncharacterized membrane protein